MKSTKLSFDLRHTLKEVSKEIKALEKLKVLKSALEKTLDSLEGSLAKMILPGKPKRKKSPHGALADAICNVLSNGKKLSNLEIRTALKASSYGFSLSSAHVSQTLGILKKSGKIVGEGKRNGLRYSLPT